MLSVRKVLLPTGVLVLIWASSPALAQGLPAIPAVPGAAPAVVAPAEVGPGILGRFALRFDAFRRRLALKPIGQLLQNAKKPLAAATGGLLGNPPKPNDKEAAAPGAGGAAAAGKKDAAEAKKRREDVAYLGTLDCRYYPNASQALADALRTDPSECVRYEAALALSRACCCNGTTLKALTASVSGMDSDGNPAERSARVRCTAAVALERCLACYVPPPEEPPEPKPAPAPKLEVKPDPKGEGEPKKGPEVTPPSIPPADDQPTQRNAPSPRQVRRARETLADFQALMAVSAPRIQPEVSPREKSFVHLLQASFTGPASPPPVQATVVQAAAATVPTPTPAVSARPVFAPPADTRAAKLVPLQLPPQAEPTIVPAAAVAPKVVPPADESATLKEISLRCLNAADVPGQHQAIRELMRYDWHAQPLVAATLLHGARDTRFPEAVRVDCVRMLAIGKVTHPQVLQGLTGLAEDPNKWVREEATKAWAALNATR